MPCLFSLFINIKYTSDLMVKVKMLLHRDFTVINNVTVTQLSTDLPVSPSCCLSLLIHIGLHQKSGNSHKETKDQSKSMSRDDKLEPVSNCRCFIQGFICWSELVGK